MPLLLSAQEQLFHPFVQNYTYRDYRAGTSNWWVIEDDRGMIYVANREGILEYDGKNWTLIESPEQEVARSLAKDDQGVLYAGFVGDLGYLAPNEVGQMQFVSLKDKIPEEYRMFEEVWRTYYFKEDVYFQTNQYIFRWTGTEIEVLTADSDFNMSSIVRDEFYVGIWGKGLCKLEGDEFQLVPDGAQFADVRMYAILPHGKDAMLIGTNRFGFFSYDGQRIKHFRTEIDEEIAGQLYSPCLALDDGRLIINTLDNGAYILSKEGRVLQNFSKSHGLQDDVVDYVYVDSRGILWMALFNGISTVNLQSDFSYLTEASGLPSKTVNDCIRHKDYFYTGTVNGVYYYDQETGLFQIVEGTRGQVYQLLKHRDRLYASSNRMGLFEIIGKKMKYVRRNVNNDFQIGMMRLSTLDSNRMYVGRRPGIASLYFDETQGKFQEESYTDKMQPKYPGFEVDRHGHIWTLGRAKGSVEQLIPNRENGRLDLEQSEIVYHHQDNGLPSGIDAILELDGALDFLGEGFFGFDTEKERFFEKEPFYKDLYKQGAQYFSFPKEDELGRTWIQAGLGIGVHTDTPSDSNTLIFKPFREIKDLPIWSIHNDYDSSTNSTVSWFSGPEGMTRYVGDIEGRAPTSFKVLLREVKVGEGELIYGGASTLPDDLTIEYQNNTISLTYAALSYVQEEDILYQTFLEGLDQGWSEKSPTAQRTYINLPAGEYDFHVKAIDVYNDESETTSYSFSIRPTIWRTWWMYGFYALLAILFTRMIVKWRTSNLKKYQKELEQTIKERTLQVVEEKEKTEKLYEYQSTLLSEVHHRIKNNLQLIMSLLILQKAKLGEEFDTGILDMLSHRINSISLIHEQLYNNKEFEKLDVSLYAEKLLENFNSLISEQNVNAEFEVSNFQFNLETITPLGLIWSELISNSLKYNIGKEGLKIFFKLEKSQNGYFMHYKDNGVGYPNGRFDTSKSGMGYNIIHTLARQLFAKTNNYNSDGAHFTMEFEEKQISPLKGP